MYIYKNGFNAEKFYKNAEHPLAKLYIDELEKSYNFFKGTPIEVLSFSKFKIYAETGSRTEYEKIYFSRRRRLLTFILKVWLEGKKEDIVELEDILWAVCEEYTWALPAHIPLHTIDLFAAETASAVAEGLSLCGDKLNKQVKERCIDEVYRRVIIPFEKGEHHFETAVNNWAAVCGGAVGMAALYLVEDEKRLKDITDRTSKACNRFVESCADDGGCLEGILYWDYGMSFYIGYAELLKQRTGEDMIDNREKLKRLSGFPSFSYLGNGKTISFSDSQSESKISFGTVCKLGEIFDIKMPEHNFYSELLCINESVCPTVRNIEWFNPDIICQKESSENDYLPLSQWAVLRNKGCDFAIKGGHNNEPHNHNDIGSFLHMKDNEFVITDLGSGVYTQDYFDDRFRYSFINTSSLGHSVPVINGQVQKNGAGYKASEFLAKANEVVVFFEDAYDKKSASLERLMRTAVLDGETLQISDKFNFSKKQNKVEERLITCLDTEILSEKTVVLKANDQVKALIEFSCEGKISIINENVSAHNGDIQREINIICFEVFTESDKCKISYSIK